MTKTQTAGVSRTSAATASGVRVGWLVAWSDESGPVVDFAGNHGVPIPARSTVAVDAATAARAVETRQGVVLVFEDDREDLPVIVGLVQPGAAVVADVPNAPAAAEVDGRRVEIEGRDEVVLRCGAASITLRRNGRVVIRGTYVETRAAGTNRIKGGSVQIN